jgi:hypothetical protein
MMRVRTVPINKKRSTDKNPAFVYLERNSRIWGLSLILGMASFKNCNPINKMANPMINPPQFFVFSFFENVNKNPKPTKGRAIALMLTLKPRSVINHAVMVVPILAPIITLMASGRVSKEAFEKLTTISVVAEEDCITDVMRNPVAIPKNLLEVMVARIDRILFPASLNKASLITFIPKRNNPREPINCKISVKPNSIYLQLVYFLNLSKLIVNSR